LTFPRFAESLLDEGDYTAVQRLLDDNEVLRQTVETKLVESEIALAGILAAIETLGFLQSFSTTKPASPWSELYIKAISNELGEAAVLRESLLMVKKMPSGTLTKLLSGLSESEAAMAEILKDLTLLTKKNKATAAPLRSEHDIRHATLRTTVVAQKVELSKQTLALSQQDKDYSKIVNRVDVALREYFHERLINPKDLFLHEVLIYDAKSPYRDVFMPRPRFAVERALSSPHDYLGCDCCDPRENGLSASQPATAILYQLYLESGALINVADLWSAFQTIVVTEDTEDEEEEQQRVLCVSPREIAFGRGS
jgi:origin recognition complex subunit 3